MFALCSATKEITDVRQKKTDLLTNAELPLDGLSASDGELICNGKKWDCMSGSDQLKVATAIVRKLNHPRSLASDIEDHLSEMTQQDEISPEDVIRFYCKRGTMENFIKESKNGFDFAAVSSSSKIVNANRLQIHALAYNIFNWFKRLALSAKMRKQQIDTIQLKLLKIAAKVVHSARYTVFKLCSSCPYKDEFHETLENIRNLQPKLE